MAGILDSADHIVYNIFLMLLIGKMGILQLMKNFNIAKNLLRII